MDPNYSLTPSHDLESSFAALTDQVNSAGLQAMQEGPLSEERALAQIEEIALLAFSCYQQLDGSNLESRAKMTATHETESDLFQRFVLAAQSIKENEKESAIFTVNVFHREKSCRLELSFQGEKAQLIVSNQQLTALAPSPLIADTHLEQILLQIPEDLRKEITCITRNVLQNLSLASLSTLIELCPKSLESTAKFIRQLPAFHDWSVCLSDGKVGITRLILSQKVPYFEGLFRSGLFNEQSKMIDLSQDTNVENFQLYLDLVYNQLQLNEEELDFNLILQLIKTARYFSDKSNEWKVLNHLHRQLFKVGDGEISFEEVRSLIAFQLSLKDLTGRILTDKTAFYLSKNIERAIDIYIGKRLLSLPSKATKEELELFKNQLQEIDGSIDTLGYHWPKHFSLIEDERLRLLAPLTQVTKFSLHSRHFVKKERVAKMAAVATYSTRFIHYLSEALPQLTEFVLKGCTLSLENFQDFPKFKEMALVEFLTCNFVSANSADFSLQESPARTPWVSYFQFLPHLKSLVLFHPIENGGILNLGIKGFTLQKEDLHWLPNSQVKNLGVTIGGGGAMLSPRMVSPLTWPKPVALKKVSISLFSLFNQELISSLNNMPQLEQLYLSFNKKLVVEASDLKVSPIALRTLILSFKQPAEQTVQSILTLVDYFPHLEILEINKDMPRIEQDLALFLEPLKAKASFKRLKIAKKVLFEREF